MAVFLTLACSPTLMAEPTATLSLQSGSDGQTVLPGAQIDWTITIEVSVADNEGLAYVSVDLVQDAGNPAFLDIPPADAVPGPMTNFSRPAGISNPGETDPATGYTGVLRGDPGQQNLNQIGGGQNTFGQVLPGGEIGQNEFLTGGIGQGGTPELVASGSFLAPSEPGDYTFRLDEGVVNVITTVSTPPAFSPVEPATTLYAPQSISFTVGSTVILADMNCDTVVNGLDIDGFVLALIDQLAYAEKYPSCNIMAADVNEDTFIDENDIGPFVAELLSQ